MFRCSLFDSTARITSLVIRTENRLLLLQSFMTVGAAWDDVF